MQVKGFWKGIYPVYFNSKKTIVEGIIVVIVGRKMPKELCVSDPTCEQISKAIAMLEVRNIFEPHKSYSRDYFEKGRFKVEIWIDKDKSALANPKIKNSIYHSYLEKILYKGICQNLHKLRSK